MRGALGGRSPHERSDMRGFDISRISLSLIRGYDAAAPNKNIENNPMQSSRRLLQSKV